MAVQYAPMKLRVPPGFQNLLEGLAREVLREQPEDIIHFAAQYFKNQLLIREETGKDDAKKGDQMEKLQKGEDVDIDLADPEVQAAATKIQASFRGHKAREDVKKHKDEEAAAVKIQAGFRGHKARERVKEIKESRSQELVAEDVEATEADVVGKEEVGTAEESEKKEDAPDVQPTEAEVAEAEAEPKEPEVAESAEVTEPAAEDQDGAETKEEAVDVANEVEAGDAQAEEAIGEETAGDEAAGEEATGEEVAEESVAAAGEAAEEAGNVVTDVQPDGTEGGEVEGEAEQVDLDMNDPELHGAAVKIQASFRGHKAREEVKSLKSSESLPQEESELPLEEKADGDPQNVTEVDEDKGEEAQESAADAEQSVAEEKEESKPSED